MTVYTRCDVSVTVQRTSHDSRDLTTSIRSRVSPGKSGANRDLTDKSETFLYPGLKAGFRTLKTQDEVNVIEGT